jgi:hypothetical protein
MLLLVGLAAGATLALSSTALASHFSVGTDDSAGVEPGESDTPSVEQAAWKVGTAEDCDEAARELGAEPIQTALLADGFCSDLVYHEDVSELTVASKPDQDLRESIGTFDVVRAERVPGVGSCLPFCPTQPGGDIAWNYLHDVGAEAGFTHTSDEADQQAPEDREQRYGLDMRTGTPTGIVQQETDAWRMNGWMAPSAARTFVGFLHDEGGGPIDPSDLQGLVASTALATDTIPKVCGWTPHADFHSTETRGTCEITFEFVEPGTDSTGFRNGYDDECNSPTYVCGADAGEHWKADVLCQGCGGHEQVDYFTWHWTVAPHPSACGGLQEPGFSFETPSNADHPYLAHDLDVYTPVTDASARSFSPEGTRDYATGMAEESMDRAGVPDVRVPPLPGDRNGSVHDTLDEGEDTLVNTSYRFVKSHRVEPNAGPMGDLDDTSQTIRLTRDDICETLETDETEATMDPWVNIVDAGAIGQGAGDYGNDNQSQDEHNDPSTGSHTTAGKVGMFADKNDDGTYDQIASGQKYQGDQVVAHGAYPMLWDVPLTADASSIDTTSGCEIEGRPFGQVAADAGYGPTTALAQAIFLREPTVFTDDVSGEVAPYPGGNNIYVLLGPGGRTAWDGEVHDGGDANAVSGRIDEFAEDLEAFVSETYGISKQEIFVEEPGAVFNRGSDFSSQCGEATGGFSLELSFTHTCRVNCSGDTVATTYFYEVARSSGKIGGGSVPVFTVNGDPHDFGQGVHQWYDVDPFDGDPDRNRAESARPPTGD